MADRPFLRGRNVHLRFFGGLNGTKEFQCNAETWDVTENADEGQDDIGGEERSRPYLETNYFDVTFSGKQRDMDLLNDFLDDLVNQDANGAPREKGLGIVCDLQDGTKAAYQCTDVTRKAFKLAMTGRTKAFDFSSGFRARFFKAVQAAGG